MKITIFDTKSYCFELKSSFCKLNVGKYFFVNYIVKLSNRLPNILFAQITLNFL